MVHTCRRCTLPQYVYNHHIPMGHPKVAYICIQCIHTARVYTVGRVLNAYLNDCEWCYMSDCEPPSEQATPPTLAREVWPVRLHKGWAVNRNYGKSECLTSRILHVRECCMWPSYLQASLDPFAGGEATDRR